MDMPRDMDELIVWVANRLLDLGASILTVARQEQLSLAASSGLKET